MIILRRVLIIFISSLIIVVCTSCTKSNIIVYSNNAEIKNGIESFINKKDSARLSVELLSQKNIDNVKIISFFTTSKKFGYAILEKGDNSRFKIRSIFFRTNTSEQKVFSTNRETYILDMRSKHNILIKLHKENSLCYFKK